MKHIENDIFICPVCGNYSRAIVTEVVTEKRFIMKCHGDHKSFITGDLICSGLTINSVPTYNCNQCFNDLTFDEVMAGFKAGHKEE